MASMVEVSRGRSNCKKYAYNIFKLIYTDIDNVLAGTNIVIDISHSSHSPQW